MYLLFRVINLIDFLCKYVIILNLMPAARLKLNGTGAKKKKTVAVENAPKTPVWIIPQVNRFTGNKVVLKQR